MTPKFPTPAPSLHAALKSRVGQYFDEHQLEIKGNGWLYAKAAFIVAGVLALYVHLIFFTAAWYVAVPECLLLGLFVAGIGLNIMHDGSHSSFSRHKWLNFMASASLECLGGSAFLWKIKHCTIHHSFTNVEGVDDDLDIGDLMRLNEHQQRHRLHRFQHIYVWVLYSLFYVSWIFFSDYNRYFSKHIGSVPIGRMKPADHIKFWVGKVLNVALYIVIPIVFVGWGKWLIGFPLVTFTTGLATALVFQLAHTVEGPEFPLPEMPANLLPDEFAIHQLSTTANFATNSRLVTWLVGGLNFQIEHHLFPSVSHVHYRAISPLVRQVCEERNIAYVEHTTFGKAVGAHIRHLRAMGRAPEIVPPARDGAAAEGCIPGFPVETA